LRFQWYQNTTASTVGATAIDGATDGTFIIPTDLVAGTHYFFARLTFGDDVAYSAISTVRILSAPTADIMLQPRAVTDVVVGEITQTLNVVARVLPAGTGTLAFQWYQNGIAIPGATSATLVIPTDLLVYTTHYFHVVVSVAGGISTTSDLAQVNVGPVTRVRFDGSNFAAGQSGAQTWLNQNADWYVMGEQLRGTQFGRNTHPGPEDIADYHLLVTAANQQGNRANAARLAAPAPVNNPHGIYHVEFDIMFGSISGGTAEIGLRTWNYDVNYTPIYHDGLNVFRFIRTGDNNLYFGVGDGHGPNTAFMTPVDEFSGSPSMHRWINVQAYLNFASEYGRLVMSDIISPATNFVYYFCLHGVPESLAFFGVYGYRSGAMNINVGLANVAFYTVIEEPPFVAVEGLSLDRAALNMVISETEILRHEFTPIQATNKTVIWTSSNPAVATVYNGVVTAVGAGVAYIRAESDECSCTYDVTRIVVVAGVPRRLFHGYPNGVIPGWFTNDTHSQPAATVSVVSDPVMGQNVYSITGSGSGWRGRWHNVTDSPPGADRFSFDFDVNFGTPSVAVGNVYQVGFHMVNPFTESNFALFRIYRNANGLSVGFGSNNMQFANDIIISNPAFAANNTWINVSATVNRAIGSGSVVLTLLDGTRYEIENVILPANVANSAGGITGLSAMVWRSGAVNVNLNMRLANIALYTFEGDVDPNFPDSVATLIDEVDIVVTPPASLVAPQTTIAAGVNYTGTITWIPTVTGAFLPETVYTATIVLTANLGYTFEGIIETDVQVNGQPATTVSVDGRILTITYVFPVTAPAALTPITSIDLAIPAPATHGLPVRTVSGENFAGTVEWTPDVPNYTVFLAATAYTITITLTAASTHTFAGITNVQVNGQDAIISGTPGATLVLTYTFGETAPIVPVHRPLARGYATWVAGTSFNEFPIGVVNHANYVAGSRWFTGLMHRNSVEFSVAGTDTDRHWVHGFTGGNMNGIANSHRALTLPANSHQFYMEADINLNTLRTQGFQISVLPTGANIGGMHTENPPAPMFRLSFHGGESRLSHASGLVPGWNGAAPNETAIDFVAAGFANFGQLLGQWLRVGMYFDLDEGIVTLVISEVNGNRVIVETIQLHEDALTMEPGFLVFINTNTGNNTNAPIIFMDNIEYGTFAFEADTPIA